MKIVATIEARMTSSRLPGKVLLPARGKPMLQYVVDRLRQAPSIHQIVLATTTDPLDLPLVQFAKQNKISYFQGSVDDVMGRVIGAAESVGADVIVEITGDCTLIDPSLIEQTLRTFLNNRAEYVSNCNVRTYPDGMDVQVFKLETLKRSAQMTTHPLDREHVTRHIRQNPDLFSHIQIMAPPELHWPDLCVVLDENADYELLTKIIDYFGDDNPFFGCGDVIHLLKSAHPEWLALVRDIKRKGLDS